MASQETTNAVIDKRVEDLEAKVAALAHDRDSAFRWGIIVLGTTVMSLATWIFNFVTSHK